MFFTRSERCIVSICICFELCFMLGEDDTRKLKLYIQSLCLLFSHMSALAFSSHNEPEYLICRKSTGSLKIKSKIECEHGRSETIKTCTTGVCFSVFSYKFCIVPYEEKSTYIQHWCEWLICIRFGLLCDFLFRIYSLLVIQFKLTNLGS